MKVYILCMKMEKHTKRYGKKMLSSILLRLSMPITCTHNIPYYTTPLHSHSYLDWIRVSKVSAYPCTIREPHSDCDIFLVAPEVPWHLNLAVFVSATANIKWCVAYISQCGIYMHHTHLYLWYIGCHYLQAICHAVTSKCRFYERFHVKSWPSQCPLTHLF